MATALLVKVILTVFASIASTVRTVEDVYLLAFIESGTEPLKTTTYASACVTCWDVKCKVEVQMQRQTYRENIEHNQQHHLIKKLQIATGRFFATTVLRTADNVSVMYTNWHTQQDFHDLCTVYPIRANDLLFVLAVPKTVEFAVIMSATDKNSINIRYKDLGTFAVKEHIATINQKRGYILAKKFNMVLEGAVIQAHSAIVIQAGQYTLQVSMRPTRGWGKIFMMAPLDGEIVFTYSFFTMAKKVKIDWQSKMAYEKSTTIERDSTLSGVHIETFKRAYAKRFVASEPIAVTASFETHSMVSMDVLTPLNSWSSAFIVCIPFSHSHTGETKRLLTIIAYNRLFDKMLINDKSLSLWTRYDMQPVMGNASYQYHRIVHNESMVVQLVTTQGKPHDAGFSVLMYGTSPTGVYFSQMAGPPSKNYSVPDYETPCINTSATVCNVEGYFCSKTLEDGYSFSIAGIEGLLSLLMFLLVLVVIIGMVWYVLKTRRNTKAENEAPAEDIGLKEITEFMGEFEEFEEFEEEVSPRLPAQSVEVW